MKKRWGIIADDLTGACDAGVQFSQRGFASTVWLEIEYADINAADLTILNTDTRNAPFEIARSKVRQACQFLLERGVEIVYKKIDSTLCGNLVAEIQAVMDTCSFERAVIAPAFPAMGRRIVDGWLSVAGCERQVHVPTLLKGHGASEAITVRDAATQEDLARIARNLLNERPPVLIAGSAGLAAEIACYMARQYRLQFEPDVRRPSSGAGVIVLYIGSTNPVTRRQVAYLRQTRAVEHCVLVSVVWDQDFRLPLLLERTVRGMIFSGGDTAQLVCRNLQVRGVQLQREIMAGIPWGWLIGGPLDGVPIAAKAGGFGEEDALVRAAEFLLGRHFT